MKGRNPAPKTLLSHDVIILSTDVCVVVCALLFERLQQEFRDKTASAVEKQSKAEATLMEERHKAEMASKASRDRISTLERAQQEAAHNIRQLTESLERQKQETYYLYTNYAQVASQLEAGVGGCQSGKKQNTKRHLFFKPLTRRVYDASTQFQNF